MSGRAKSQNAWQRAHSDRINLTVPKGQKETIQAHAAAQGESANAFINRAVSEAMERDREFESHKAAIVAFAQQHDVTIENQNQLKRLYTAFATLAPVLPDVKKSYFLKCQAQNAPVKEIGRKPHK